MQMDNLPQLLEIIEELVGSFQLTRYRERSTHIVSTAAP